MNIRKNAFKKVRNALCLIFILSFISCVNKIEDNTQESNIPISFSTKMSKSTTKVTQNTFNIGDKIGVFAVLTDNSLTGQRYIDNLYLECGKDATLIPQKEVFYPEGDATLDFISYFPYQAEGITKGSSQLNIAVQADQHQSTDYSLSNFMTAQVKNVPNSTECVQLEYKHQLAKIKIVLAPKKGENVDDMLKANPRIVATGFKTQAVYDLQSGELSEVVEDSETDIIPFGTWKKESDGTLSGKELIVIPQTHRNNEQAFTLEWNGKIYACSIPSATIKEDTELEIRIDALQSTSKSLTGIVASIKDWSFSETGTSENKYDITVVHTASLSFSASDVYRIYYQGKPVAEICREYLKDATDNKIQSKAIVVYPVLDNEKTDLSKGIVLELPDKAAMMHGGTVRWDIATNALNYVSGSSKPIEKFYIDGNKNIVLEEPATALPVNVSSYVIRDIRNGVLQTYPIVKIGTQYWMKEDLKATYYNDNKNIPLKENLGEGDAFFEWIKYDLQLYNGEAVLTGKLAPQGWKLTTEDDWNKLKYYIGENASILKKNEAWNNDSYPATNETGLSILPNGFLLERDKNFVLINHNTSVAYWTYDDNQQLLNKGVMLTLDKNDITFITSIKPDSKDYYNAFSVRCIKE